MLPLLEKDILKVSPATMVMLCEAPLAGNVLGVGYPPLTVTVALGAELLMVTVICSVSVFTV